MFALFLSYFVVQNQTRVYTGSSLRKVQQFAGKGRFFDLLLNIVAHVTLCNRLWMRTSQWYFVLVLFCPITLLHRVLYVLDIEKTTQVANVL